MIDPDGRAPDWIRNGDGTYTAEKGDSAWSLHKQAGISFAKAQQLLENQGKSNLQVGDNVRVFNQKLVFVNGKLGMGSPDGGRDYWDADFVNAAKNATGSNMVSFINTDYGYSSSANDRFNDGYNSIMGGALITKGMGKGDQFVFVTHSMGAAYGEGMTAGLEKQGWGVEKSFHFNAFQAADIKGNAKFTVDFQTTNDPVINNPVRSSPGSIQNGFQIRDKSNSPYSQRHRSPIDNAKTWDLIKSRLK